MNNIIFERNTNLCLGINREPKLYEYEVKLPYPINLTKTVSEKTSNQIQKTDSDGNLLYKLNIIIDEFGNEIYEETIESYIYNNEELIQLEPIMIDEFVDNNYNFADNCTVFTYEEVLEGKIESINNSSLLKLIYFDEDFLTDSMNFNNCSLGDGLLILYQNSSAIKEINLTNPTEMFELYSEMQSGIEVFISSDGINYYPFVKDSIVLENKIDKLYLQIRNMSNSNREVYCIGLSGGVF